MNAALETLAKNLRIEDEDRSALRWAFCYACANDVRHLVEHEGALAALDVLRRFVAGEASEEERIAAAESAATIATQHRGSTSVDGASHAFVSATFSIAKALAGKPIETADYAAYATVYHYGAYALTDPSSFDNVHQRQLDALNALAQTQALTHG